MTLAVEWDTKHQHRLEGFDFIILIGIYCFQKSYIFREILKQQLQFSSFYFSFKIVYYRNRYTVFSPNLLLEKYHIYCDYKNTEFNIYKLMLKLHSIFHLLHVQNKRYNTLFVVIKLTFTKCFIYRLYITEEWDCIHLNSKYIYCYIYSHYKNNHGYRYTMCLFIHESLFVLD